jgi:multidrug efflux system outer membrane protein
MQTSIASLALSLAVTLSGCAAWSGGKSHDDAKPPQALPATWQVPGTADTSAAPASTDAVRGWGALGDPQIEALIAEALGANADLVRAIARVDASRAALQVADADRWPAVFATAGGSRSRSSDLSRKAQPAGTPAVTDFYHAGVQVQYEVDLWGKFAKTSSAARATLFSVEANRDAVRIAVAAQVAQSVYAMRALNAQSQATHQLVDQQREALALQHKRFELGASSEFDWRLAQAEVAGNEARLPALEAQRSQAETALAVLLGREAREVYAAHFEEVAAMSAQVTARVPEGLPSELLLRRPDLRAREQALAAADANVAVARANYFPSITLTGNFGSESASVADLFKGPGFVWNLAASLTQPIWQAGRLFAQTDAAIAQRRIAEADYREAIATAFKEVRDAVVAQDQNRMRLEFARTQAQALERALALVQVREKYGVANRLERIDAERQWLLASMTAIDAQRDQQQAVVNLLRALGGGW